MSPQLKTFYAVLSPSLEPLFEKELLGLKIRSFKTVRGGCRFQTTMEGMMRVNLWSRYASRILLEMASQRYQNEEDIYRLARGIAWEEYINERQTLKVEITSRRSPLRSINFAALKIKDAICDRFRDMAGTRPDVAKHNPDVRIYAHLTERECHLYLDTSGESLFKRGWRQAKGEAPLKENLAAALLGLADWTPEQPLYDPFCGSGTILIEAACLACHMPPGLTRRFAFEKFKGFDASGWQAMKSQARAALNWDAQVQLAGSDISTQIVDRAAKNAALAGLTRWMLEGKLKFFAGDAREVKPPFESPGLIVTNPPYGEQSNPKSASVASMMKNVADNFKHHFDGWVVWMLTSDLALPRQMRLSESRKTVLFNGPLECRFFRFEIKQGSMRRVPKAQPH